MIQIWDVMGHSDFDVCSDDHCQRYQGLNPDNNVDEAINETAGMILKSGGEVCFFTTYQHYYPHFCNQYAVYIGLAVE